VLGFSVATQPHMTSFSRCFHSQTMNICSIFISTGVPTDLATIFSKGGRDRERRQSTYLLTSVEDTFY
jgi:hypothetical protein